jgi:hypothetical protein
LLDAVDQGQSATLLLELERLCAGAARARELGGAVPGERGQAVALDGGEAAVPAVDVGVDEAEPLPTRPERGDDAAALPARLDALGTVA